MERSLGHAKKLGWERRKVEVWNPHVKRRQDLFEIIDMLALVTDGGDAPAILGVQVTDQHNYAAHVTALVHDEKKSRPLRLWLMAGGLFEIWAWAKHKVKRGGKAYRYNLQRHRFLATPEGVTIKDVDEKGDIQPDLAF
jgi:hypothetical protein